MSTAATPAAPAKRSRKPKTLGDAISAARGHLGSERPGQRRSAEQRQSFEVGRNLAGSAIPVRHPPWLREQGDVRHIGVVVV